MASTPSDSKNSHNRKSKQKISQETKNKRHKKSEQNTMVSVHEGKNDQARQIHSATEIHGGIVVQIFNRSGSKKQKSDSPVHERRQGNSTKTNIITNDGTLTYLQLTKKCGGTNFTRWQPRSTIVCVVSLDYFVLTYHPEVVGELVVARGRKTSPSPPHAHGYGSHPGPASEACISFCPSCNNLNYWAFLLGLAVTKLEWTLEPGPKLTPLDLRLGRGLIAECSFCAIISSSSST
ncbi:hypothetical protein Fot_19697 [Forsythia ovata]|uniref:Uncharacterized protein n=1 Tax=Forsythia ovata TaxID=205694 RepID=A0ABD1VLT3_9LAMI